MIRWLAILGNLGVLLFIFYVLYEDGLPSDGELLMVVLFFVIPILSLSALFLRGSESDNLLSLFFKRLAMQERKKIKALEKDK